MTGMNASQRLVSHLERANTIAPNTPMVEALNTFFSYKPIDPYREHARRLDLLLGQVDLVESGLKKMGVPEALYGRQVTNLRGAFTASALNATWNHVLGHLTPDVEIVFRWAAYSLAFDEDAVDEAALAKLLAEIQALQTDPALAGLPPAFRELIGMHLNAILDAITAISLTGIGPLQKAVQDLVVFAVTRNDDLRAEESQVTEEAKPFLAKAFSAIKGAVDVVSTGVKTAENLQKIYAFATEKGPLLIELAKNHV